MCLSFCLQCSSFGGDSILILFGGPTVRLIETLKLSGLSLHLYCPSENIANMALCKHGSHGSLYLGCIRRCKAYWWVWFIAICHWPDTKIPRKNLHPRKFPAIHGSNEYTVAMNYNTMNYNTHARNSFFSNSISSLDTISFPGFCEEIHGWSGESLPFPRLMSMSYLCPCPMGITLFFICFWIDRENVDI